MASSLLRHRTPRKPCLSLLLSRANSLTHLTPVQSPGVARMRTPAISAAAVPPPLLRLALHPLQPSAKALGRLRVSRTSSQTQARADWTPRAPFFVNSGEPLPRAAAGKNPGDRAPPPSRPEAIPAVRSRTDARD